MRASSDGWSVTVRAFVRPGCWFTARRYGIRPVGIHWKSHTVFSTSQYCMDSVHSQTRSASMCGRYAYRKSSREGRPLAAETGHLLERVGDLQDT